MLRPAAAPLFSRKSLLLAVASSLFMGCHDHGSDTSTSGSGSAPGDATLPTVISFAPDAGAVGVSVDASMRARFSESMDSATIDSTSFLVEAAGTPIAGVVAFDTVADTATFTPHSALPDDTQIEARLTTDVSDLAGNQLETTFIWTFTTEDLDTAAPAVVSTIPTAGTTDFPIGGLISATFSENLDFSTVNVASFLLMDGATPLAGFVKYDPASFTATFAPASPLPSSSTIHGLLTQGIRDVAGNALDAPFQFTFSTEAIDTMPPSIVATLPPDLATNVPITTMISATFSEALTPGTVTNSSFTVTDAGAAIAGTVNYDSTTFTATFVPAALLPNNTTLRADIFATVADLAGNTLSSPAVWTFTTEPGDTTPPTVSSVNPMDQATDVAQNGLITATFSEDISPSTLDAGTFLVSAGGVSLPGIVGYDAATLTATFAPSTPLPTNSAIMARLTAVIADLSGNRLDAPFEWSFTTVTVDNTSPTITSIFPADLEANVAVNSVVTATFSEAIDPATLTSGEFTCTANNIPIPGILTYDSGTLTAIFRPNVPFTTGTIVRADVNTGITDLAGNALLTQRVWTFTTEPGDTTPPTVVSTLPTAGTTNYPLGGLISATFSEDLDVSTVNVASFMLMDGGTPLAGFVTYDPATFTATFAPAAALPTSSAIDVVLTQSIRDVSGNALAAPFLFTISTEAIDTTPPSVLSISPPDQAASVPVTAMVSAVFSEALEANTVTSSSFSVSNAGAAIQGTVNYDPMTFTATFAASVPFPHNTTLRVDILPSIADRAGNTLASPTVWTFTTELGDTTPPTVTSVDPMDLAANVAQSGLISATFSENIHPATLNSGTFLVTEGGASLPGILGYDAATFTATFAPTIPLPANANIVARLTTVLTDVAGNGLAAPFEWSFTTVSVDNTPPTIVSVVPGDLEINVPVNSVVAATFSEAIEPSTLTSSNFSVTANGLPIQGAISYDGGTFTATFTPNMPFTTGTIVRADVTTGVADLAGNGLAMSRVWTFTTEPGDTIPPAVVSTSPTAGTTNFPLGGLISATFSESLDPSTINVGSFQLMDGGTPIAGFVAYDSATLTATFAPATSLPSSATINVLLTQNIRDVAGNALAASFPFAFTTEAIDATPPAILAISPPDQAINVPVATTVSATFSEALDPASVTDASFTVTNAGAPITGTVAYDAMSFTATFVPSAPFSNNTTVRVDILATVADLAGNTLASPAVWTFTTDLGDTTPPTVTSVDPVDLATNVAQNGLISATFSEDIDPATLNAGTFLVTEGGASLPGILGYDAATFTATFAPTVPLPANSTIVARLSTVITDSAGNRLAAPFTWSFVTVSVDNTRPEVVSIFPGDFDLNVPVNSAVTATFSEAIDPSTLTLANFALTANNISIPGFLSYDGGTFTATFTPNLPFTASTIVRADVRTGIADIAGNTLATARVWTFTTEPGDTTPPAVVSTIPVAGTIDFPVGGMISVTFSEDLDPSTVDVASLMLMEGATPLAGFVAFDPITFTATFAPAAALPSNSTIDVSVTQGIRDVAGNALAAPFLFSITTEAVDTTPPSISATLPSDNATNVPVTTLVSATFSEALDPTTVTSSSFTVTNAGTTVPGTVSYDPTLFTATFMASAPFPNSTTLRVNVAMSVADLAGNTLPSPSVWTFTTDPGDITPPTVTSALPLDQTIDIDPDSLILAAFSEAMDPTTLNANTFTVTSGGVSLPGMLSYDAATFTASFSPSTPLPSNSVVTARLAAVIADEAGNRLAAPFQWSFTIILVDNTPPTVVSVDPTDQESAVQLKRSIHVIFSEALDASTVSQGTFIAGVDGVPIGGQVTYDANTFTVTLDPDLGLPGATTVDVRVTTGITDAAGNALADEFTSSFVTPFPRYAYSANFLGNSVAIFRIDSATGRLDNRGYAPAGLAPRAITLDPQLRFAYAANSASSTVTGYLLDSTTGELKLAGTTSTGGLGGRDLLLDPSGRFLYVVNAGTNDVSMFAVNPASGSLSTLASPVLAGSGPRAITINEAGTVAYVVNDASNNITTFSIDPLTGILTRVGLDVDCGLEPQGIVIGPCGQFAYVANEGSDDVSAFAIDPTTGVLTRIGTDVSAGDGPRSVDIDPTGRFAYVASEFSNDVTAFLIDQTTGALNRIGNPTPSGDRPIDLRVDPSGRFIYVSNFLASSITVLAINPMTGTLTLQSTTRTPEATRGLALTPASAAPVEPTPLSVYTANFGSDDVTNFSVDTSTGGLSQVGLTAMAGGSPRSVVVHPSGRFAYVANFASDDVAAYSVLATDGSLTAISSPVLASTEPRDLTIEPSGRFLYVANGGSNDVTAFWIDQVTGKLTEKDSEVPTGGTNPRSLTTDPAGRFLYVANSGSDDVTTFRIDSRTGEIAAIGLPVAAGDQPQDVFVHPTGQFVYVSNEGSDDVTTFAVDPVTGTLTEVGTEVSAGDAPRALVVEPSGRFAYVPNGNSNDVTQFMINQADGSLTQFGVSPMPGMRPIDIAVDHSGRFVYVADFTSSTVSTFQINPSTGILTLVGTNTPGTSTHGVAVRNRDQ